MEIFMKLNKLKVLEIFFLLAIFILGFTVRLYKFNNPIADWHSWRQADTAAVTRNFIKDGFTPLLPRFDAFNSLNEFNLPNPNRYFLAEFPIYNIISYFTFTKFGHFSLEQWGRLTSIFFASLTSVVLYFLVKQYSSKRIAMLSAFIFTFLPYNIYYGRVIMPDPLHIFFSVTALLALTFWLKKNNVFWAILAGFLYTGALLTKPYALVLLLPIAYLIYRKFGLSFFKKITVYVFILISFIPFALWRWHIGLHPEGQFGTTWLFNQGNIRFTGAFFRWLIYDRMNRLIFATGGFVLFWIGIIRGKLKDEGLFYYLWFAAVLVFFTIIAKGNVTHDYYQMPIVPIGCILIAKGVDFLLSFGEGFWQWGINIIVAVALILIMFSFGWYEVRGYFNINHPEIVAAGQEVNRILPENAKVIAPYQNDSAFLYQTNRHGWTSDDKIPQYIQEGATNLVSVNYDDTTNLWMSKCRVVEKQKDFVILDLTVCK
jgi:hypothetical protein